MFEAVLYISLFILTISMFACLYRVIKGPTMPDRVMALDLLGVNLIASIAIISILVRHTAFVDAMLLLGILSFIGTVALSRFIERGVIIVRKRDY
ncbi:Na(+)/H(+) antiporter subunit F1 [bacterium LRH843]|nr:Na(+)/H(+) antiporter subunit F1 [bacterium LRH843]